MEVACEKNIQKLRPLPRPNNPSNSTFALTVQSAVFIVRYNIVIKNKQQRLGHDNSILKEDLNAPRPSSRRNSRPSGERHDVTPAIDGAVGAADAKVLAAKCVRVRLQRESLSGESECLLSSRWWERRIEDLEFGPSVNVVPFVKPQPHKVRF